MFILIFIVSIYLTYSLTIGAFCQQGQVNEAEFKDAALQLAKLVKSFDIDAGDYQKQEQKIRTPVARSIIKLNNFVSNYPANKYADDAVYILTTFSIGNSENHIKAVSSFLEKYPDAILEEWTLNNLGIMINPFAKEIGAVNAARFALVEDLYDSKQYEASAKEAQQLLGNFDIKKLSVKGSRTQSMVYYYLLQNAEALNNNEQARKVCQEAIKKIQDPKGREVFIKKLRELDARVVSNR